MKLQRLPIAIGLALGLAASTGFAAGNINSGTTKLEFTGTPFSTGSGNANLWFGSSFNGTDMLSMINWSYHQGVGTSIRPFSSLGGPVESYVGNVATFTWTNAGAGSAGVARFDAVLTFTLSEIAAGSTNNPGAARVDSKLVFKSNAGNAGNVNFSLFNHMNFDILGTNVNAGPDDTHRVLDNDDIKVRAFDSSKAYYAEMLAVGAQRYEFNTGTALRTKLGITSGSAGFSNLANLAGTSVPDYFPGGTAEGSAAFQWGKTLAPGESMTVYSQFTINAPVPEPGSYALMALGLAGVGAVVRRRRRD